MNRVTIDIKKRIASVTFVGSFISFEAPNDLYQKFENSKITKIILNGEKITQWDSSFLLVLFNIEYLVSKNKIPIEYNKIPKGLINMLNLSAISLEHHDVKVVAYKESVLEKIGGLGFFMWQNINKGLTFISKSFSALWLFILGKSAARKIDFLFVFEDCGPNALGIVGLISFLVGLILAFVGAIQLKTFGAQVFVADLVTIGMLRIMGAIMVGIIMTGRTGASFAATIGSMQANEEIDALTTMGILWSEFLVAPRLAALIVAIPFLTIWADFLGILGGAFVGIMVLDIPSVEYFNHVSNAWSMKNFWVGIFHGFVFSFIIAICGCYYGINTSKNADGVGFATTKAVVSSIVWLVIATGVITFVFERLEI